jgi:hypothetical protein
MAKDAKPRSCRPTVAGTLLSALAFCGGCSLLLHADANQCSSDSDCAARGPAFSKHTCQAGTCVAALVMTEAGSDAGREAEAQAEAQTEAEAEAEAATEAGPVDAGCATNADCTPASSTHTEVACEFNSRACIQLTTDECPFVIGDYSGSVAPPLFLGAFATLPPSGPKNHTSFLNYTLAINEFTFSGGIPAGPGNGLRLPAVVVCNSEANAHTAMVHLQADVHVPAVLAALDSVTLRTEFVNDAYPNKTFVVNPFGADSTLTSLQTDGLLWHMLGQPSDNAAAYAAFFPRLESYARTSENLGTTSDGGATPLRVATVTANATVTQDLAAAVLPVLNWNGQSVAQNTAAGLYKNVTIESVLSGKALGAIDVSGAVSALLSFRPNVIVSFASLEFVQLLQVLEIDWQTTTDAGASNPRPVYLVGPYNMGSQPLLAWIGPSGPASEAKRTRVSGIGVASASDPHELIAYQNRFLGQFTNGQSALGYENYYDAMYFMVYAAVGAGRVPNLTGTNMAQGMLRLLSGTSYDMGPAAMGSIFGALGAPTGTISLFGALGSPDFTRATGARVGQGSVYCVNHNSAGSAAYAYDVMTLTPADGGAPALGGTFSCYGGL